MVEAFLVAQQHTATPWSRRHRPEGGAPKAHLVEHRPPPSLIGFFFLAPGPSAPPVGLSSASTSRDIRAPP